MTETLTVYLSGEIHTDWRDHVRAGIGYGHHGLTAYYYRDRDHHSYNHDYRRGHYYGASYYGEFYGGHYYPYGYASDYDVYYHRYPYHYERTYDNYPTWVVYVDPAETVYIESPQQTVYVEQAGSADGAYPSPESVEPGVPAPPVEGPTEAAPSGESVIVPDQPSNGDVRGDAGSGDIPPVIDGRIEIEPQERIPVNNALLADAERQFREGHYEEARGNFVRAVLNDPRNGFAELAYGLVHFAVGDYQAAARAIRRGAALAPDVVDRPIDVTRQYGKTDDYRRHVQALQLYVASHPDQQDAWFLLGYIHYSSGEPIEALRAFEKAAALDPADTYAAVFRDAANRMSTVR